MQTSMRIQCPKNLKVPSQGSYRDGVGPKIDLKGLVNVQYVNIHAHGWSQGIEEARLAKDGYWFKDASAPVSSRCFRNLGFGYEF
uniref:Uncharacterized protein n=1 Tax=Cucumis melo TaxID=3656 RepID=A0A9I9E5Z8_CUCME